MADKDAAATATTNDEDQREAERIQVRLRNRAADGSTASSGEVLPCVEIAEGAHKYVLLSGTDYHGDEHYIVTSLKGAEYHRNAAEPMIAAMEEAGYSDIIVAGGGRITCDTDARKISIYGFSYGFGKANHEISRIIVLEDPRYKAYEVTFSDDGY